MSCRTETYRELEIFSERPRQALRLRDLQVKYQSQILSEDDLPAEYLDTLIVFRYCLNHAAKRPMDALKGEIITSGPFRLWAMRTAPTGAGSSTLHHQSGNMDKGEIEGQLFWILRTTWEDDRVPFFLQLPIIVHKLQ